MKKVFLGAVNHLKNSKATLTVVVLGLFVIALFSCFFAYSCSYQKILPNVVVHGLNAGGMTEAELIKEIESSYKNISLGREITISYGDKNQTVSFETLKAQISSEKTAQKAMSIGRDGGPFKKCLKMLMLSFAKEDCPMEIYIDKEELGGIIDSVAPDSFVPATEISYTLDEDTLIITMPKQGQTIDLDAAMDEVKLATIEPSLKTVYLKTKKVQPKEVDFDEFYGQLTSPVKDAEYVLENGEVKITEENYGITIDKETVKKMLKSGEEVCKILVETQKPSVTAKELEDLLFRDNMGSWTSDFSTSTAARANNVMLTAQRINGTVLMPGDVFSYDEAIGKRTIANGYKEAGVYIGNKVESGIGGGICQTSSTLYSAALYANLEIVKRVSHSLPVSYVPMGQDATIAEGYIDLKIKNNTSYPVKIVATTQNRKVTCSFLGVKEEDTKVEVYHSVISTMSPKLERTENPQIPKGYKRILNKGADGYKVASKRVIRKKGEVVKTEELTKSVYQAAPIEEEVNPEDLETPSEQLQIFVEGMVAVQPEEETASSSGEEVLDQNQAQEVVKQEISPDGQPDRNNDQEDSSQNVEEEEINETE